jgi:hypothetical protein
VLLLSCALCSPPAGRGGPRLGTALCNIPVFRYALERWASEPYEVLVVHRGPLDAQAEAALKELRSSPAKLGVERVDLGEKPDPAIERMRKGLPDLALPCLVIRYPRLGPEVPAAWAGPLTLENVRAVGDSPARREIVRRILSGESAVWLLLESGDAQKDDGAASFLQGELEGLAKRLKLPGPAEDDPPVLSPIALRIAFSVLRVSRTDPAEMVFVSALLNSDPELSGRAEPVTFPIFGRARALRPMVGKTFTAEFIGEVGEYLVGPCGCEAKALQPGLDLPVAEDWEARLLTSVVSPSKLPKPEIAPGQAPPPQPAAPGPVKGPRWALWIGVGAAALLVLFTGARVVLRR